MKIGEYTTYSLVVGERPPKLLPPPIEAKNNAVLTREFMLRAVAVVFDVAPERLAEPGRGRARIALARQVAMYLAHVGCELSLTAVGRLFGRDRTTVAHACQRVEDAREVAQFDSAVGLLERSVRAIVKTSPALRRDLVLVEQATRQRKATQRGDV